MAEWKLPEILEDIWKFKTLEGLKEFQESGQEYQIGIFQCQDTRNLKQEERTLGTYELGQEKKAPSYWSNQIQWSFMSWNWRSLTTSAS